MRQIIYLLLIANAVYFVWNLQDGSSATRQARPLPPIPESIRSLVTLREMQEMQQEGEADASGIETITQHEPPGAGFATACQTLGPFLTAAGLQQAASELDSRGLELRQYESEEQVQVGYWIFMPPMERGEARKITAMLDGEGDKEYYIGTDNLVALGAFDSMERAKVRLGQVRKYGLEPRLEPRYDTRTVHWLELQTVGDDRQTLAAALDDFPNIQVREASCDSIAAENTIH
jgi:hypothetical protein